MRCVVIGGAGFIGSAVCDRLLREGHAVRVFERHGTRPYRVFSSGEPIEWMTGDLLDPDQAARAIHQSDVVLHLAWTTLPESSLEDPVHDLQSNLVATLHLLEAMRGQRIGKILFISSGGTVYGPARYLPIDERHPTEPIVSYGITKLTAEKYLLMYQRLHGIQAIILRVACPYGERHRPETRQGAVGIFMDRALRGETLEIWGDGHQQRDFLHVTDVAEAFARAVTYTGCQQIFNIGSGVATSLNALIDRIEQTLAVTVTRRYRPARAFDVPINVLDTRMARRELGWEPTVPLTEGLARTAAWMIAGRPPTPGTFATEPQCGRSGQWAVQSLAASVPQP